MASPIAASAASARCADPATDGTATDAVESNSPNQQEKRVDEPTQPPAEAVFAPAAASSSAESCLSALPPSGLPLPLTHIHPSDVPATWTVAFGRYRDSEGNLVRRQHPESLTCTRVHSTPLMVRVDNFLTADESAEIVRLATTPAVAAKWRRYHNVTYTPTTDSAGQVVHQEFTVGPSDKATLHQLDFGHYQEMRPLITLLCRRIAHLVGVPATRISNLRRLLRYGPGQKFDLHADDYDRLEPLPRGRRCLTCLIYVHTETEETGGGTVFPLLDGGEYRSPPTTGSLLVFRNFDPNAGDRFDSRCQHYAESTTKGYKYALNLYIVEKDGRWWN